jgi:hypothetical protein
VRKLIEPLSIGLGVFLVLVAVLLRFYAYPKVASAPIDQQSVTSLEAKGATLFDTGSLKNITTDLSVQARTVGDVAASKKAPDGVVVWVSTNSIRSSDGTVRSRSVDRAAFDDFTGEAVNCCGGFVEETEGERTEVKRKGLVFKFPFATEKKTYMFWDGTLGEAVPAKYTGTATLNDLKVYKFQTAVPDTVVGTRDLPASVLGLPGTGNVTAETHYQDNNTMYVDPNTGAVVNRVESLKNWYAAEGQEVITTEAELTYTKKEIAETIDDVGTKGKLLKAIHGVIPIAAGGIGLILLLLGSVLSMRRRGAHEA